MFFTRLRIHFIASPKAGFIQDAVNIYLEKESSKIAGYRPWTHGHFIRSLTDEQRETLALEVYNYIIENGVRDIIEE